MTLGTLTLSFTEVILETSFDPTNIALLNAPNGGVSLTLSSQSMYTRSSTGTKVEVDLIPTDLNWLKARSLYTSRANSYLSLVTNLVDIAGNVFQDIQVSNAIQAAAFAPDTAPPTAASFDLFNIDNGSFIITFNEPVDTNTVNFHMIILLNTPSGSRRYGVVTNQSSRKKKDSYAPASHTSSVYQCSKCYPCIVPLPVSVLSQRSGTKKIPLHACNLHMHCNSIVSSFTTADVSSHLDPNCAPGASHSEQCQFPNMLHTI